MLNQSSATSSNLNIDASRGLFLILLTLMSTAGLVGSDVYLPTLPSIGEALDQSPHAMQLTLGIYLLGLSIGQLICGPLTDRFGRKNLLIIGMLIYLTASISCAFSFSYSQMLISRFLQALGACSGLVIGRAIVGDIYEAKEAGKIFSTIFPFVGMSPAISPVIGGYLGFYFGWQSTFLFVAMFAAIITLLAARYLPETLALQKRQPLDFVKMIFGYPKLLINKKFIAYASAPCAAYIAYFAYITSSPYIFHAYGYEENTMGTFYITLSALYVAGNLTGRKLLSYYTLDKVIKMGYTVFVMGGLLIFLTELNHLSLLYLIGSVSILTFGNGFLIPLGTAGVISTFSKSTGYASGLLGFLQLGSAAAASSLIGLFGQNLSFYLSICMFFTTIVGASLFILLKGDTQNV